MSYILAKDKKHLIDILKKTGDDVILVKCTVVYAFPKGMYESHKEELKKYPDRFKYYRVKCFVGRIKFKRIKFKRNKSR